MDEERHFHEMATGHPLPFPTSPAASEFCIFTLLPHPLCSISHTSFTLSLTLFPLPPSHYWSLHPLLPSYLLSTLSPHPSLFLPISTSRSPDPVPHAAATHRTRTASSPIPYAIGAAMPPGGTSRPMSPAGSLSTSIPKTGAALMEASMGERIRDEIHSIYAGINSHGVF